MDEQYNFGFCSRPRDDDLYYDYFDCLDYDDCEYCPYWEPYDREQYNWENEDE